MNSSRESWSWRGVRRGHLPGRVFAGSPRREGERLASVSVPTTVRNRLLVAAARRGVPAWVVADEVSATAIRKAGG